MSEKHSKYLNYSPEEIITWCNEINSEISEMDRTEQTATDMVNSIADMQQRLDAAGLDVEVKVNVPPRCPQLIMQEAEELKERLTALQAELFQWQAMQPVETAH